MNIRKPVNYSSMFAALDTLMVAGLSQMKLYLEIGRIVGARTERGAAVTASEYLRKTYPDTSGFSPRNLRRMREFFQAYESNPEVLVQAMAIGWTQNIVILENCETLEERTWYINTVCQFNWSKTELLEKISSGSYKSSASALCTNESAEDQISSSETGLSNKSTSSHASSQTDFSQLNPQKMTHWNKQFPQNEQKIDAGHGPANIQNQRCDGLRPANPFRRCPKPMTMELSTKIGYISALCEIRPGLPPLFPPVDRQDNPFPSSRAGYAAQDRKKYGLHQGWKERHYRGPKPRYEAAPHPWFSIYT